MRWSIGRKMAGGFGLAMLLLLIMSGSFFINLRTLLNNMAERSRAHATVLLIEQIYSTMLSAQTGQRGFLITGEEVFLEPYSPTQLEVQQLMNELRTITADIPVQQQRITHLAQLIDNKYQFFNETIELRRSKRLEEVMPAETASGEQNRLTEIRQVIDQMKTEEEQLLEVRQADAQNSADNTINFTVIITLLIVVVLTLSSFLITRNITRQLQEGVNALASSSNEISVSVAQLSSASSEMASAVVETTTTVEEVKQTSQMVSQKAEYVASTSRQTQEVSQAGKKASEDVIAGMSQIQRNMESIGESIMRLSEQSQAIGEIIATVDDLTDQSNLLAVNAAIEAARAGEQGKGFAVVAQEIKSLADRSKQATLRVRAILNEIQKATSESVLAAEQGSKAVETGVTLAARTGESILTLSSSIAESNQAAIQIAAATKQQLAGVDQAASAMENIKTAVNQNVASAKQLDDTAGNLVSLGRRVKAMITNEPTVTTPSVA